MIKAQCIPNCPARLVAEDAFKADPVNIKKFFIEVQQLNEYFRSEEDLNQSASDWFINENNKLSQKYGFPSIERLNELCICGFFKRLTRITKTVDSDHFERNFKEKQLSLSQQQQKFSLDVAKLINFIYESSFSCTFGEALRTKEMALLYYKEGKGIIDSLHCQRLAVDLNIFDSSGGFLMEAKDYEKFGVYWESLDPINRWGGRFTRVDADHFERNFKE